MGEDRTSTIAWRKAALLLVVLLLLSQTPEAGAFTSLHQQQSNQQRSVPHTITRTTGRLLKGARQKQITQSALGAISSRELRKREEGEKQARIERRKKATTKRKTKTVKADDKMKQSSKVKVKKKQAAVVAVTDESPTKKAKKKPPQKTKSDLTQRLQRATAKAKAAALEADYVNKRQLQQEEQGSSGSSSTNNNNNNRIQGRPFFSVKNATNDNPIGTLTQLTKIIDKELRSASDGTATFNVHGTTNPPPMVSRDSMRSLLEENDAQWSLNQRRHERSMLGASSISSSPSTSNTNHVRHVAVVMSKPLVQDQVTLEYACRLRTLAKAMKPPETAMTYNGVAEVDMTTISDDTDDDAESSAYRPNIVCFLGPTSNGNLVADSDAGYIYFNHLCAANQISLDGVDILLEKSTLGKGALKHVMRHLRQEYIPEWWKESYPEQAPAAHNINEDDDDDDEDQMPPPSSSSPSSTMRKKIQVHFTFFSCDYDLCRINDIHYRSPRQSVLRHLVEDEEQEEQSPGGGLKTSESMGEFVDTSWSYRFSTYPYVHFKDPVTAYLGKCFLLAEELTPVLVNIRGVNDGTEFFQRDNYRVLVSIRRSFVTDMEQFYKSQPSLKTTLRQYVSNSDYPLDVVLEGALLSLGRCLDLVRPAGLLIGYVPKEDWKTAEIVLQHAVRQLRDACDPDHPLDPGDWGKLDHYYDQHGDYKFVVDGEELAALNNWRIEEDDADEHDAYTEHHAP